MIRVQRHNIEVENGENISAIYHQADSDKWIFFCHGFGSDKEGSFEGRCEKAVEEGFSAVRFDFRGNGESDGDFIDQDLSSRIKDLKSVVDYFEPGNIFLMGMSFGGKVVLHSLTDIECKGVVLKSPVTFNSIMDKFKTVVQEKGSYTHFDDKTIDKRFFNDLEDYNFRNLAENIEVPVAFFHGSEDATVHFSNTLDAFDCMDNEASLFRLAGEKHSMSDNAEERFRDLMFSWINSLDY